MPRKPLQLFTVISDQLMPTIPEKMHQTRSGFFHDCLGPVCLSLNFICIFDLYNIEHQQVQYLNI